LGSLRAGLPGIGLVQVIHVTGEEALEQAREAAPYVSALLLDSGNPGAAVPEFGGTGRVHDWALSRRIVEASPGPVFLAGGLCAENVGAAITAVRPFAVDVCSGVRASGRLMVAACVHCLGRWRRPVGTTDKRPIDKESGPLAAFCAIL
jgi:phosphoribosylanthranilate isomerase